MQKNKHSSKTDPSEPAVTRKIDPDDYSGDADDEKAAVEQATTYMNDLDHKPNDQSNDISNREGG
jgi:hypothetical protein